MSTIDGNGRPHSPASGRFTETARDEGDLGAPLVEEAAAPQDRVGLPEISLQTTSSPIEEFVVSGRSEDSLILDAPYQRGSVWSEERQRNLLRSLLMKLPIGAVVISRLPMDEEKCDRVVDGKQRIEAIRAFVDGDLQIPSDWVHNRWLPEGWDAPTAGYSDFTTEGQRRFKGRSLPVIRFDPTKDSTRQPDGSWAHRDRDAGEMLRAEAELYGLINFGGVAQTEEDAARAAGVAQG